MVGRSQRHRVYIAGGDSAGKGLAEGQPAIVYIQQNALSQAFAVPVGATGGPLKGSTIAGYPPVLFPPPKGLLAEREQEEEKAEKQPTYTDPGQFNLSGNPHYIDLPPADTVEPEEPPVKPEEPPVEPVDPRNFPIGPFDLVSVTQDGDTMRFLLGPGVPLLLGDQVSIEATGNTLVNGSYAVKFIAYNEDGMVASVDNTDAALVSPIDNRGRLTITG